MKPKRIVTIEEAERYIENAKTILHEKAILKGEYYRDAKYVKMACNTAWGGVLIAVEYKMTSTGFKFPPHGRKNVDIYRDWLARRNGKILDDFNTAYNYLHLLGGYDGDLYIKTSKEGLMLANRIIKWCKQ